MLFFFSTLSTYWEHISAGGVDEFVYAYLVETLVIQAFACEFREVFSAIIWNLLVREFLMLVFCLRCRKDTPRSPNPSPNPNPNPNPNQVWNGATDQWDALPTAPAAAPPAEARARPSAARPG